MTTDIPASFYPQQILEHLCLYCSFAEMYFPRERRAANQYMYVRTSLAQKLFGIQNFFYPHWEHRTCVWDRQGAHPGLDAVTGRFDYPGNKPAKRELPARSTIKIFRAISYFHSSLATHLYCGVWLCSYSLGFKLLLIRALVPHWDISSRNMNTWR